MSYISNTLREKVRKRAKNRCEYCLIYEDDGYFSHEIDHIYATKHGGETDESNLCLSCWMCNRYKGSDLASIDPLTKEITILCHPRTDRWEEHFSLNNNGSIEPLTPQARVTVSLLQMNKLERIIERKILIDLGNYL
jgi:hypothetical protein